MSADRDWIVERANALGFELCGVVRAERFPELAEITPWLDMGYAGEMCYLHDVRRREPSLVMEDLRSAIVCALTYNTAHPYSTAAASRARDSESPRGWISRYAWGDDYHEVVWEKLNTLVAEMKERFPQPFAARAYADTGPISERVFAKHAGLGWIGKNTLLLNKKLGSWFFLGVILTSLKIAPSLGAAETPPVDLCGTCQRCLQACPTGALVEPYVMDARRCISYLTIELRGSIPEEFREGVGWHVYGCDICQDVCPYNRTAPVTEMLGFEPRRFERQAEFPQGLKPKKNAEEQMSELKLRPPARNATTEFQEETTEESLFLPRLEWLAGLSEAEFREAFRGSAMKRAKWAGLVRNACIALGNCGVKEGDSSFGRIVSLLERLSESENISVSESASWALSRIERGG